MNKQADTTKVESEKKMNQSDIIGKVVKVDNKAIVGWAQYKKDTTKIVEIDVYEGTELLETIRANQNTELIGIKNFGYCGFVFPLSEGFLNGNRRIIKFIEHTNQRIVSGSPFKIGNGSFDLEIQIENGYHVQGFIRQRTMDNAVYTVNLSLDSQRFWQQQFHGGDLQKISVDLPESIFTSQDHTIQIKICDVEGKPLLITVRKVKHSYQGGISNINFNKIKGWIINQDYPLLPVEIDVAINGNNRINSVCNINRFEIQKRHQLVSAQIGFEVDFPASITLNTSTSIEIFIKGTKCRLLHKQYVLTPKDIIIRSLISASEHLNSLQNHEQEIKLSAGINTEINANALVRQQIIAPIINQLRHQPGISTNIKLSLNSACQLPAIDKSSMVDIIIPVYQGYDETIGCINSVLLAKNNIPVQIIVINDQSPDGRLKYKLQALAKEKRFTLIENKKNLGFVASANIGLGLHKDRDVVLLNSDTEVYDGWLDRMLNIAQQNNNIATVTPFSNNATICSFPEFNRDNPINKEVAVEQLDQWFSELNGNAVVDLPTAVGFCMLIKREVLESIGYLNANTWNKGYGEENDFCLKASALGWRHVLATGVFVKHYGAVSFAEDKQQYLDINLAKLNKLYPDYSTIVQRFILQDPGAKYRNSVIKKIIQQQSKKHLLFIMHGLGGGAKTNADQMAALLTDQGHSVLELIASSESRWELKHQESKLCLNYQYPKDYNQLENDLRELDVWHIHFHQLIGFPKKIWLLPEALSCAYDYTAHDFFPICPRVNMIDESGRYCGESQYDNNKCQRCIQMNGLPEGQVFESLWQEYEQSVSFWRKEFKQRLTKAEKVFCPSQSTAKLYKSHYELQNTYVKLHPEKSFTIQQLAEQTDSEIINIAIIGAIGPHKGSQLILDCAKHALKEGLPLHFVVVGYSNIDESFDKLENVTLTGAYEDPMQLKNKLQTYQCQLALFLSVWPETFCYTLTEALQNGLYPIALNYGAIAERIKKLKYGQTLATNSQAKDINKKLMSIAGLIDKSVELDYPGAQYPDVLKDYYHINESY